MTETPCPEGSAECMAAQGHDFIVELLVVVEADSFTDAEALGERAAKLAAKATTPKSAGKARIINVIVSEVRDDS